MNRYQVVFSPRARRQLLRLELYIADRASEAIARNYVDAIVSFCENLKTLPKRGTKSTKSDFRVIGFRKRVRVIFRIIGARVQVVGIYYAGRRTDFRM